jgi:hypothetical protein
MGTGQAEPVTILELIHTSGAVVLRDVEARIVNDRLELRGMVDASTWERIELHDIFGATSRIRSHGFSPVGWDLRITVTADLDRPTEVQATSADSFVIVDAMRRIDGEELRAAGLDGEIWEGLRFCDPQIWAPAVDQLATQGFEVVSTDSRSTMLVTDTDGDTAMVRFGYETDAQLVHIAVSAPLPLGGDIPPAIHEAIDGINALVPWSTTTVDGDDVLVRDSVSDDVADQGGDITFKVQNMLGLLWVIRGPMAKVVHGALTPQEALDTMFSG